MVEPEIKDYHSADIDSVWTWEPNDLSDIFYNLELTIGEKGKKAGDIFQITVATPEGLRKKQSDMPNIQLNKMILVMNNYDWESIMEYCQNTTDQCSSDTWERTVEKLCRYFKWEYEGHEYISE